MRSYRCPTVRTERSDTGSTKGYIQNLGSVRFNRNEVGRLHCHIMLINPELEMLIRARVNQSNPILLARDPNKLRILSASIEFILPVEKTVVTCRRTIDTLIEPLCEGGSMIPILDHDGSEVNVPICSTGTVDDEWADEAFGVLQREVRMVPCVTVTGGPECISERFTGRDGTSSSDGGKHGVVHCVIPGTPSLATLCSIKIPCQCTEVLIFSTLGLLRCTRFRWSDCCVHE